MDIEQTRNRDNVRKVIVWKALGNACSVCGEVNDLQVDHKDSSSRNSRLYNYKGSVGAIWRLPLFEMYEEIKKCQLLCHNCHMNKTLSEQGLERQGDRHNLSRYTTYGCRCDVCKKCMSDYMKEYRGKRHHLNA